MSVFKKNFLPSQSQPWARQVEDKLADVEARFKTEIVNNRTRDEQLQSSYNRLDKAVQAATVTANTANAAAEAAQDAIDATNAIVNNIYVTGTTNIAGGKIADATISAAKFVANTITGDIINGGTITGATLRTAASGQRVEVNLNSLDIYGQGGTYSGNILGLSSAAMQVLAAGDLYLGGSRVEATANLDVIGALDVTSDAIVGGSLTRTALAGGGTTGASINNAGNFIRTTSSQRYKTDILDLNVPYEAVLNLQPKMFKRTEEADSDANAKFYPGFIAEDLAGTDLDIFTFYSQDEEGNSQPEGIHYAELTAALVSAIKTQHQMIESLQTRLEALESR